MKLWVGEALQYLSDDFTFIRNLHEGLSKSQKESIEILVVNLVQLPKIETLLERLQKLKDSIGCHIIVITNNRYHQSDYPALEIVPEAVAKIMIDELVSSNSDNKFQAPNLLKLGSETRKVPLLIMGLLLCLEPLFKILYLSATTNFPIPKVIEISTSAEGLTLLEFWFIHPLAGIALMFPFGLSILVFISFHIYSLFTLLSFKQFTWPYISENPHPSAVILVAANLLLISFLLMPRYRKLFLGKTIKLFRQNNRFNSNIECKVFCNGEAINGQILDYSSGGVQIDTHKEQLPLGGFVTLEVNNKAIPQVKVVRLTDKGTYGLCFYAENKKQAQADFDLLEYFIQASV